MHLNNALGLVGRAMDPLIIFKGKHIVALKQKGIKSIFLILRKQQKNNWHNNNFSTIGHKLLAIRGNLAYFENV